MLLLATFRLIYVTWKLELQRKRWTSLPFDDYTPNDHKGQRELSQAGSRFPTWVQVSKIVAFLCCLFRPVARSRIRNGIARTWTHSHVECRPLKQRGALLCHSLPLIIFKMQPWDFRILTWKFIVAKLISTKQQDNQNKMRTLWIKVTQTRVTNC